MKTKQHYEKMSDGSYRKVVNGNRQHDKYTYYHGKRTMVKNS